MLSYGHHVKNSSFNLQIKINYQQRILCLNIHRATGVCEHAKKHRSLYTMNCIVNSSLIILV